MSGRGLTGYAVLVGAVLALSLAARSERDLSSPVPSVTNPGAAGVGALFTYLKESGFTVGAIEHRLDALPADARTVAIVAPDTRVLAPAEVDALGAFMERGGTVVYLLSRAAIPEWIPLSRVPTPLDLTPDLPSDPLGLTAQVIRPSAPNVTRLRVGRTGGLTSDDPQAVPLALTGNTPIAFAEAKGKGLQVVFAGPDIAENRRLELLDNLAFWTALASDGPLYFDEFHHRADDTTAKAPPWWIAAQGVLCVVALGLAGVRLGPPRVPPTERHRSSQEYLHSFAWLVRRAGVERDLAAALYKSLRRLLHQQRGLSPALTDDEVARELSLKGDDGEAYRLLAFDFASSRGSLSASGYTRLSRRTALFESRL